ncbi:MAG: zinc ABC transporter substrate-binding protein [Lachnospiraceae bacterium]|nr:zinc ABC transporter substrate-binding protein [Lachnospiraceae bacterium]
MKRNKYRFVCCMLLAIALASGIFTKAYLYFEKAGKEEGGIRVVTSFYPVYIAAENVAGNCQGVILENLSEPQTGCMHDYQLTPQDMILLSKADLFLINGGGIEGFLAEVGEAYPELEVRTAAEGISLMEDNENAHGWMDTRIYAEMVENIADFLSEADPAHRDIYQENASRYCAEIEELTSQIEAVKSQLAESNNVVIFHEAYEYTAEQYGLHTVYCLDLDEERQVSAGEVADLLKEMEENQVSLVLAEELYGKDMGETVKQETGCQICYLDTLVRGDYDPDSYLEAMQKNIDFMRQALEEEISSGIPERFQRLKSSL